jgi:hypothetical protein
VDGLNGAIVKYRRQADEMEEILSSSPADAVVWPPGPGRWSILEIAAHLADAELLASARIRRVLTQDRPTPRSIWIKCARRRGLMKIQTSDRKLDCAFERYRNDEDEGQNPSPKRDKGQRGEGQRDKGQRT